ncbi:hypothetical protein P8452_08544 [Trifolium repens]|nr:hypothetical protein P8452_08544 [Trifolium repens]
MAPRKPSGSTSKKQKAVTSSSQGSQEIDGYKFKGPVQFERYQVLETRKIWSERVFNIDPEGSFKKFAEIVDNRGWDKLINPPKKFNPSIVTDFMQMHTQLTMHHSPTLPWLTVPRLGSKETPLINDEYVDRHCKPKMKKRGVPSPEGPSAPPSVQQPPAAPAPNFGIFYNYLCNQNDASFRAMTAVHESIYRPNFSGGDGDDDVDDAEAGNEEEEAGSDASMDEGNEDYASD